MVPLLKDQGGVSMNVKVKRERERERAVQLVGGNRSNRELLF